ncbi:MAG: hypothetical protein ACK4ON_09250 [Bacteroidia bacterium]
MLDTHATCKLLIHILLQTTSPSFTAQSFTYMNIATTVPAVNIAPIITTGALAGDAVSLTLSGSGILSVVGLKKVFY